MKRLILFFLCVVFLGAFAPKAKAGVNVNINVNLFPQYDGFVSGYYGIPEPEVVYYQDRLHSWQDAATLFFLSRLTGCYPRVILGWRLGGMPWVSIVARLGVPYNVFYVPYGPYGDYFMNHDGPPYGNAWGYWRRGPRGRFLVLNDQAIRNRVSLIMTSQYYHIPVQQEAGWITEHRVGFGRLVQEHWRERNPGFRFDRSAFEHGARIPFYNGRGPQGRGNRGPQWQRNQGPQGRGNRGPQWQRNRGPQGRGNRGPQGHGNHGPQGHGNRGPQGHGNRGPQGHGNHGPQGRGNRGPQGHGNHGH